jgi:sortase (surface protein transpeptidase)
MTYVDSLTVGDHHYILWYQGNYNYQIDVMFKNEFITVMSLTDKSFEEAMRIFQAIGEEEFV